MLVVVFHFPRGLKFFDCRESLPEGWTFLSREILLDPIGVLVTLQGDQLFVEHGQNSHQMQNTFSVEEIL